MVDEMLAGKAFAVKNTGIWHLEQSKKLTESQAGVKIGVGNDALYRQRG